MHSKEDQTSFPETDQWQDSGLRDTLVCQHVGMSPDTSTCHGVWTIDFLMCLSCLPTRHRGRLLLHQLPPPPLPSPYTRPVCYQK